MQNPTRSQSIRWKITAAFLAVAAAMAAFVGVATRMQFATVERAATLEAQHVAEGIAESANAIGIANPARLQAYIAGINAGQDEERRRDVVIVDAGQKGLADAHAADVGQIYRTDPGDEVGLTIQDGRPRTFIEKNGRPEGERQIVVPLQQNRMASGNFGGAIVLEYTPIRNALIAAERNGLYLISAAGLAFVLLAGFVGFNLAGRIARPLEDLKNGVGRMAGRNYAARVAITSQDEIGVLGTAFNTMAEDLGASHAALLEHGHDLEERIAKRTGELSEANAALQQQLKETELAAERIEYLAFYDGLTTLPNRAMFSKLLNQAISLARRYERQFAVLFVDLDRFKNINDALGHEAGDLLLLETGKRLKSCLRESDTVGRLGGDEFVVLLPEVDDAAHIEAVARKILVAASKPFAALGQEFRVTASVGIGTYPKDGIDERSLMKNADIAMYKAKEEGRNNFRFYSEELNAHSFERLALESSLRRALERNEFELHYQPKLDLPTGRIVGMEALLRWRHPELGMVAPPKFIPLAEETGLIVPIGKWVLKTACMQNVAWQQAGLPSLILAVNLSSRQFLDEYLLDDIKSIVEGTGMDLTLLELELTESMLMHNVENAMRIMQALKKMGVRLAIDDFGTGYSSLSNLKKFPMDTIKIDRSFINELPNSVEDRGINEAIIAMGKTLGLTVVAEGVETKEQLEFLRESGCHEFQGFYFSKAVEAGKFSDMLQAEMSSQTLARGGRADRAVATTEA